MPVPIGLYARKEEALAAFREYYDDVKDEHAVYCVDTDNWAHSDEASQCYSCDRHFFDYLELNFDGICIDCWGDE